MYMPPLWLLAVTAALLPTVRSTPPVADLMFSAVKLDQPL